MKAFVAGATGVLGRRVVPLLLRAGHDVTALARTDQKAASLQAVGATPVRVDLFDPDATRTAVAGHDIVCNLATHIPSPGRMARPSAWAENDRVRTEISRNLADAVIDTGAGRFIQESIAYLYRDAGDRWIDEEAPVQPVANLSSATVAESNASRVNAAGSTAVVLRFATFYGPDSDTTLLTIRMAKRRIAVGAAPDAYVSSITTDDAASAVVAALGAPAGVYNVGDDEPVTRRAFFTALADALGTKPPLIAPAGIAKLGGARATILTRSQRISNRRFADATGWAPVSRSAHEGWPAVIALTRPTATTIG